MAKEGYTQVILKDDLANELKKKAPKDTQLSTYVQDLLKDMLESDLLKEYAPLQFLAAQDNSVVIKDRIKNRIIEVIVRNGELVCTLDDSKDCLHIGFAWSIPALYKILKLKGAHKP